jgi:mannose-6-phosphate isomerase
MTIILGPLRPLILSTNRPAARFYAGGAQIDAFRSLPAGDDHTPEDWVASTTPVRGQAPAGLSILPDGTLLLDAVIQDPEGWLGADHVARWGPDAMILVKLLDAGQRLPVHAHPDDAFAAAELTEAHGKAEAWFILEPGVVYLGLREDIDRAELARLVREQDTTALLGLLNEVTVATNDAVVVPPGTLHAIGRSVLLAEVQQPSDLSILLEWDGFAIDGEAEGHLGLGFERALEAVDVRGMSAAEVERLVRRSVVEGPVFPPLAAGWFRLDRVTSSADFDAGFAVVIAVEGRTRLITAAGMVELAKGETAVVPAAAGPVTVETDRATLVARPPAAVREN